MLAGKLDWREAVLIHTATVPLSHAHPPVPTLNWGTESARSAARVNDHARDVDGGDFVRARLDSDPVAHRDQGSRAAFQLFAQGLRHSHRDGAPLPALQ